MAASGVGVPDGLRSEAAEDLAVGTLDWLLGSAVAPA